MSLEGWKTEGGGTGSATRDVSSRDMGATVLAYHATPPVAGKLRYYGPVRFHAASCRILWTRDVQGMTQSGSFAMC